MVVVIVNVVVLAFQLHLQQVFEAVLAVFFAEVLIVSAWVRSLGRRCGQECLPVLLLQRLDLLLQFLDRLVLLLDHLIFVLD